MKVTIITMLLAVGATVAVTGMAIDVASQIPANETNSNIRSNKYSEINAKDAENEDSDESSSEEHDAQHSEQEQVEEDDRKVAIQTCSSVISYTPVGVPKPTDTPDTQPSAYVRPSDIEPADVKPVSTPATKDIQPTYQPVVAVATDSRPVVTTESAKPTATSSLNYAKTEAATPVTMIEASTANKYVPISFEKPVATPAVTIRKTGWVRAAGYKLGYARAESSNPAVVQVPTGSTPSVKDSQRVVAVDVSSQTGEKSSAPRQTYPKWFFKTKSTRN